MTMLVKINVGMETNKPSTYEVGFVKLTSEVILSHQALKNQNIKL